MCKLRNRWKDKKEEVSWLFEKWQIIKGYNEKGDLLWIKNLYRVAPHAGRANYATASYEVSGKDIQATKVLSGHTETKNLEKYIEVSGIMERKKEVCDRYMSPLTQVQKIPLLVGQKKLDCFI